MQSKAKMFLTAIVFNLGLLVNDSQAGVIFQEDWQSHTMDPKKWIQNCCGTISGGGLGSSFLFDLNRAGIPAPSGDIGLFLQDPEDRFESGVRSFMSFHRSQGLSAAFKLMVQPGSFFLLPGPAGPWVQPDQNAISGCCFSSLKQIEAGISNYDHTTGATYYVEGTSDFNTVPLSAPFTAAFKNATSKASAIDVRVTLGTTTGARMEWSVGSGPLTTEFDTIGQTAERNYLGANRVSSTPSLRLFFGGGGANLSTFARAVVDDIVVTALPEPASSSLFVLATAAIGCAARRSRTARP